MDAENDSTDRVKATKDSWEIIEMPKNKVVLPINKKYSKDEYNKIKQGFIPKVMEDRWFVYFEDNKLYMHRSWTGNCIYELNFSKEKVGYKITKGYLNGNIADQIEDIVLKEEVNKALLLIDRILLDEYD